MKKNSAQIPHQMNYEQEPQETNLNTAVQQTHNFQQGPNGIYVKPKEISLKATLNPDNYSEAATEYLKNKGAIRSGRIDIRDMRRKAGPKYTEEERRNIIDQMRERDEQLVTGIFNNYEARSSGIRGDKLKMTYKKYSGETEYYQFEDNIRYTIPYGLAHHLQFGCYTYAYNSLPDDMFREVQQAFNPEGKMLFAEPHIKEPVQRFGFIPIDFSYHVETNTPSTLAQMSF